MNLESQIKNVIANKLEDGTVERLVEEHFEKGVSNALGKMFESYGDVTKAIEAQMKSVLLPFIENYDYSKYVVKLDTILTDLLNQSHVENRKLLENFKDLMSDDIPKKVSLEEIFEKYKEYVAERVETRGLEIDYDDEPTYEAVEVTIGFEEKPKAYASSSFLRGVLKLGCEHDEDMNIEIDIHSFNFISEDKWTIDAKLGVNIESLKRLDDFEVYIMKLAQSGTEIDLNIDDEEAYVTPNTRPEASY